MEIFDNTPIEVTPMSELFDTKTIRKIKKRVEMHQCHSNAAQIASDFNCEYVEVMKDGFIPHCINRINGKYFDATLEKYASTKGSYDLKRIFTSKEIWNLGSQVWAWFITFQGVNGKYIGDDGKWHPISMDDAEYLRLNNFAA